MAGGRQTMSEVPPPAVERLLDERARARRARDFVRADALRDEIRELGWEPIDSPDGSTARPALPESAAGPTGYARPEDLASLLDEAATLDASLIVQVADHPGDLARLADGLRAHRPDVAWELVVVANGIDPVAEVEPALHELPAVVLASSVALGWADAANLGLRRARGGVAVLVDTSVEPTGDFLAPLLAAFRDPGVGLAGPWGVVSADARQFGEAGSGEVDAIEAYCLGVRREALRTVRGFDPRFRFYRNADLDFSFAVRDAGWRAVATGELPLRRHEHRGWTSLPDAERDRLSKRNFYRFLDHWGRRPDLLVANRAGQA
jgi:GT2 family glycosyltransferase